MSDKVGVRDVLTEVEGLRDIVEVAAGLRHAAAVDKVQRIFLIKHVWGELGAEPSSWNFFLFGEKYSELYEREK